MGVKLSVDEVIDKLQGSKTNLCCEDVKRLLVGLGFEVRDGKKGGHKIFVHDGLPSFQSGSFNCGHGKNPEIKPAYIKNIIKALNECKDELKNT
jgi:predicted RNA binding protein YcfA (HicA-like mRNA interferase family)